MSRLELSRGRFLQLAWRGAGLSFVPAYLARSRAGIAQTAAPGAPAIAGDEYPVGLWWPPPAAETTEERYRQIAEAGFNFVIGGNGVTVDSHNQKALNAAAANNLRFVLTDRELHNTIRNSASASSASPSSSEDSPPSVMQFLLEEDMYRSASSAASDPREAVRSRISSLLQTHGASPALAGLNLFDEPHRSLFNILGYARQTLQELAAEQLPFVNVWPSYASLAALGTSTYKEYLKRYLSVVKPPVLCFDHYPLLAPKGITSDYFYNWALIRRFALDRRIPSWTFIQSVSFEGNGIALAKRRRPSETDLRWQVNVSLAYGAKGIQYFTYWTPNVRPDATIQFGEALVSKDGQLTELYNRAKRVNRYLSVVGKVLLPLVSETVVHAGERRLPRGAKAFKGDGYVISASGSRVILSRFRRPGVDTERYLFVANLSFSDEAKTRLGLSRIVKKVYKLDSGTGQFVRAKLRGSREPKYLQVRIPPGGAHLYRLQTA